MKVSIFEGRNIRSIHPTTRKRARGFPAAILVVISGLILAGCRSTASVSIPPTSTSVPTAARPDPSSTPTAVPTETVTPLPPTPMASPLPPTETIEPTPTPNRLPPGVEALSLNTRDGLALDGFLYTPDEPVDESLAVVLAHEYYSTHHSWAWMAERLQAAGIASLVFDARGHGKSPGSKDYTTAETDVMAAVGALADQGYEKILCLGTSMGGSGCLVAALEMDLAGIALISSPMNLGGPRTVTAEDLANLTIPKVFMVADGDEVKPDFTARCLEAAELAAEPKALYTYPGGAHAADLFFREDGDAVQEILFEFVMGFAVPGIETGGRFREQVVAKGLSAVSSVQVADLDGDGDGDILAAVLHQDTFAWWRNMGGDPIVWEQEIIASDHDGAISVSAADVDWDGDLDLVGAVAGTGEIAWWRNGGGHPIIWEKEIIASGLTEPAGVAAADLDGDGDMDILGTDAGANQVLWWENQRGGTAWTQHLVNDNFDYTQTIDAGDLDGDGDLDLLAGAGHDNKVAWWTNQGGSPLTWDVQTIKRPFRWVHWVETADIDGDGRLDVLGAAYSEDRISWFRNAGGDPIEWQAETIAEDFLGALTAHAADLDKDGDLDVIGTANKGGEIAWWRNQGGTPITWEKQDLREKYFSGAWALHAGDLDGDGDVDIVGGGYAEIIWWENLVVE